jgi:hypothetical protein
MKTLFKLSFSLFSMLFMAAVVSNVYDVEFAVVAQGFAVAGSLLFAVRVIAMNRSPEQKIEYHQGLALGVALEFWESTIAEYLFKEYPWLMRAKDRSGFVLSNSVVHIPQAGALPDAYRNRSQYPVKAVKRSDSDITYPIDEISTDATHIKDAEKVELSYDKVASVLGDHIKQLNYKAALNAMYRWMFGFNVTDNIVKTTGSAAATYLAGATGNRNLPLVADVSSAKTILVSQTKRELNPGKRALIMSEGFYNRLKADTAIDTIDEREAVGAMFKDGDLVKLHGFDIIRTDVMPRLSSAWAVKDPFDQVVATGDNDGALMVDFDFVHIAKSEIKVFETLADAAWQGDLYSALLRMGASRERNDQAGIVVIAQQ